MGSGCGPMSASESESESGWTPRVGRAPGNAGPIALFGGDGERRVEGPGEGFAEGTAALGAVTSSGGCAGVRSSSSDSVAVVSSRDGGEKMLWNV